MDDSFELKLSLGVCLLLSGAYVAYELLATPSGGQPFGHALGILGTLLMVATEVLYSLRKRTRLLQWGGPVRYWLSAHIFTGIVGPFMILMHSAFMFSGLAGLSFALTLLVVGSGFLGRYFYSSIPRSLAGTEATAIDLMGEIRQVQAALAALIQQRSTAVQALVAAETGQRIQSRNDIMLVVLRAWDDWRYHSRLHGQVRKLERAERNKLGDIERLMSRRRTLERQVNMMESARRLLSVWHVAHVPMGIALFASVALHVAAEIYFRGGLLR
jgi:hypothetical protein